MRSARQKTNKMIKPTIKVIIRHLSIIVKGFRSDLSSCVYILYNQSMRLISDRTGRIIIAVFNISNQQ